MAQITSLQDLPAAIQRFMQTGEGDAALRHFQGTETAWGASVELLTQAQPESVLLFAANTLLQKSKSASKRPAAFCQQALTAVLGRADQVCPNARSLLLGGGAILATSHSAIIGQLFQTPAFVALTPISKICLLGYVGQEASESSASTLNDAVQGHIRVTVMPATIRFVLDGLGSAGGPALAVESLKCLEKWASGNGSIAREVDLGFLVQSGLLEPVLAGLGNASYFAATAAVLTAVSSSLVAAAQLDGVASRVLPTLAALAPTYQQAVKAGAEEWCSNFVVMIVAAGASLGNEISKGSKSRHAASVVAFLQLMVGCVNNPRLPISEETHEFWSTLCGTCKITDPALGTALYTQVAQTVLNRCAFPTTFTTWDDVDGSLDEDEFDHYRRSTQNLLQDIATFMLDPLIQTAVGLVAKGGWQNIEIGLFLMGGISESAMPRARGRGTARPALTPGVQKALEVCFRAAFATQQGGGAAHPMSVRSALYFIGQYAFALPAVPPLLVSVKQFLVAAFQVPATVEAASLTFRYFSTACGAQLAADADADVNNWIQLVTRCTYGKEDVKSSVPAVEGMMRIILLSKQDQIVRRITALIQPLIAIFRQATEATVVNKEVTDTILAGIRTLVPIIRRTDVMDSVKAESHPIPHLITAMWSDLGRLQTLYTAVAPVGNKAVLEGLCDVYDGIIHAGKQSCLAAIPNIVQASVAILDRTSETFALKPISSAIELHASNAELQPSFTQLLDSLFAKVQAKVGTVRPFPSDAAELLAGLLQVGFKAALFVPTALGQTKSFVPLMELTTIGITSEHRGLFTQSCTLLITLAKRRVPAALAWFRASGMGNLHVVLLSIVQALAGTAPLESIGKISALLYELLAVVGAAVSIDVIARAFQHKSMVRQQVTDAERAEFAAGLVSTTEIKQFVLLCKKMSGAYRR